jgi:hypothetical protein
VVKRLALSGVFLVAAGLKAELLLRGHRHGDSAWGHAGMISACIVEVAIAVALLGRARIAAAYAAIAIAAGGLFVAAYDGGVSLRGCGCFGRVRLSTGWHIALSLCVFGLAARIILESVERDQTQV